MMKKLIRSFLVLVTVMVSAVNSQITISDGSVDFSCSETLLDPGGTGRYGNNENVTYTICSDNGGVIILDFTSFSLESGYDYLSIYSGADVATGTLMGDFSGTDLVGYQVTGLAGDQCLTLVFYSDGSGRDDGFEANISCGVACQTIQTTPSYSVAPGAGGFIDVCKGTTIDFFNTTNYPDNNTNYAQSDATSTYRWEIGNAATINTQNGSYQFNDAGVYSVNLTVTDIEGCENKDQLNQFIRVSPEAYFDTTGATSPVICLGDQNTIIGAVTPDSIIDVCSPPQTGTTFLPDGVGVAYRSNTTVTCFNATQTLSSASDLVSFCLDLEHSYASDITIDIECPNGQMMRLFNRDLGGAIFGEPIAENLPIDGNTSNEDPGIGYTYCFSPNSSTAIFSVPVAVYTDPIGNVSNNIEQIPAGDYQAYGTWSDLIGCPLNGDWTLIVTDNLPADNGNIFEWSVDFDPNIPTIGGINLFQEIVSEQWQADPTIVSTTGNNITVQPTTTGTQCYTYEAVDGFGCTFDTTVCFEVVNPPVLMAGPNADTCGFDFLLNGSVTWADGNTADLSYEWNMISGPGNAVYNDNTALQTQVTVDQYGSYVFELTTQNGSMECANAAQVTVNFSTLSYTNTITTASCGLADASITITPSSGTAPYTLSCTDLALVDQGTVDNATLTVSDLAAGTYIVTLTDGLLCPAKDTLTIVNNSAQQLDNMTLTHLSCFQSNNGTAEFTVSGAVGNLTYIIESVSSGAITSQSSNLFTGLAAGDYNLTVTDDGSACEVNDVFTLTQPDELVLSGTVRNALCNGVYTGVTGIDLSAAGGTPNYQFSFDGSNYNSTNTINDLSPGTYMTYVLDDSLCGDTLSLDIIEPDLITYTVTSTDLTCNGSADGNITFTNLNGGTVAGNYNVVWTSPSGASVPAVNTLSSNSLTAGQYQITISDDNGCQRDTTITLTEPNGLHFGNVTVTPVSCNGGNDGSISIANSITADYALNNGAFSSTTNFTGLSAGTYTLKIGNSACSQDTTVIISSPAVLTLAVSNDTTVCNGSQVQINALATGGSGNYNFAFDNGAYSNNNTYTLTVTGAQTISVLLDDGVCPIMSASVDINLFPALDLTLTHDPANLILCAGDEYNGLAYASGGSGGNYQYTWTNSVGTVIGQNSSLTQVINAATTLRVNVTDACNTTLSEDIFLDVVSATTPLITVDVLEQCAVGSASFTIDNPESNAQYDWTFSDDTYVGNSSSFTQSFFNLGCVDAQLVTTINNNGTSCQFTNSYDDVICVYSQPIASFSVPASPSINDGALLFTNNSIGGNQYLWDFNGQGTSTLTNPSYDFQLTESDLVLVGLLVTDSVSGCSDYIEQYVKILEELTFFMPNTFSPNGDGINELFHPVMRGYDATKGYKFMVFDRWGQLQFYTTNPQDAWDGMSKKGKVFSEGIYYWKVEVRGESDYQEYSFQGHVNLLMIEDQEE